LVIPLAAALVGCAGSQRPLVLDPAGPAPSQAAAVTPQGTLIVDSACDSGAPGTTDFSDVKQHTDYKVYSKDGKFLQVVHNHLNYGVSSPARVALPSGTYHVVAESNGSGTVTMSVTIEVNQVTVVHLEGGGWRGESKLDNAHSP